MTWEQVQETSDDQLMFAIIQAGIGCESVTEEVKTSRRGQQD
jgi:hypothetical protein